MRNRFYFSGMVLLSMLTILFSACGNDKSTKIEEPVVEVSYPQAEWSKATEILMHTPSYELFDGVIHPSAGLFENYFDVDSAASEHIRYIEKLRENGVRVITVADILRKADREKLRVFAECSLVYDCSEIPDQVESMEIYRQQILDEMSIEDMIRCILYQPTVKLSVTEHNTGYKAEYSHKPVTNLYFTRDQSITTPRGHVICNMNSIQREFETDIIKFCYEQMGKDIVYEVQGEGRLEGGDYMPAGTIAYIGCGMRTNQNAIDQLLANDVLGHDTLVVCRDYAFWQMQMHLDTYFNIIDKDLVTLTSNRLSATLNSSDYVTVDVYARPVGGKEYSIITKDMGFVDFLKQRGVKIISIDNDDMLHYANNFLCIAPRHIIAVNGQSQKFQDDLAANNVTVEWLDIDQIINGYGAGHCMTQVIGREPLK